MNSKPLLFTNSQDVHKIDKLPKTGQRNISLCSSAAGVTFHLFFVQKIHLHVKVRRGQGFPFRQRGWKTFVVGPPGRLGEGCVHPRLAGFAYPTNDVAQTSHAGKKKSLFGVKYKMLRTYSYKELLKTVRKRSVWTSRRHVKRVSPNTLFPSRVKILRKRPNKLLQT